MAAREAIGRGRVPALLSLVALALLALVVLRAYQARRDHTEIAEVPLLRADPSPVRERPADPGGMEVPFQDTLLFDALGDTPDEPRVERLLPPPEEPLGIVDEAAPATEAAVADDPQVAAAPAAPEAVVEPEPPALTPPATPPAPATPEPETPEPETTEPETTEPETTAALAPAPTTGFRVQIGSFRGADDAAHGWDQARVRFPDLLGELGHIVDRVDLGAERGVFHRLQAGPFPTREVADSLCNQLKARDMDCFVVGP